MSPQKELMTTIFVAKEPFFPAYADMALQLVSEARQMGFAHFLLISNTQAGCDKMLALDPLLSCAWDSTEFNGKDPHVHQRLRFFGRAIRLGYNVLQLDGDTVIFRDPYVYLKRPPLAGINLLTAIERGHATRVNNIGMVYAQNCRPDGPTAWVFRWLVEITLRYEAACLPRGPAKTRVDALRPADIIMVMLMVVLYPSRAAGGQVQQPFGSMDDKGKFTREQCNDAFCVGFDQAIMDGAVTSAELGRHVFPDLQGLRASMQKPATQGAKEARQALEHLMDRCIEPDRLLQVLPDPPIVQPDHGHRLNEDFFRMVVNNMTVPNLAYGYPPLLGGRLFTEVPNGSFSSAWHAQLRDDCPDCSWWDEQRPLKGGRDSLVPEALGPAGDLKGHQATPGQFVDEHIPKEVVGQAPAWFVHSMTLHRFGTWLGPGVAPLGSHMVIGHVHGWRKQQSQGYKIVVRKMTGRYNWTLAAQLTALKAPYMVAQPGSSLKLLALAPHIDLERTRDLAEFNTIVLGLLQVSHGHLLHTLLHACSSQAVLSNRALPQQQMQQLEVLNTTGLRCILCIHLGPDVISNQELCRPAHTSSSGRSNRHTAAAVAAWHALWLTLMFTVQAALLSKRVAVLPQLPCETPWLHGQKMDDEHRPTDQRCIAPLFNGPNQDWPAPLPFPITPVSKQLLGSWTHWSNCSNNLGLLPRDPPLDVEAAQHDSQFWAKQRYSTTLTYLMDQSCAGDVGGLLPPEYAHWLQCEAPAGTQVHSSCSNTVLQVSPNDRRLHLQPSSWPGGERFRLAPGSVLQANTSRGWSWRDVQVSVSTREVARQLHQVAQQPLVYLGHPILLAPPRPGDRVGEVDSKAGEGTARHLRTDQLAVGDVEARGGRYRRVMKKLRGSFCRAMFADSAQEAHRDNIVMLTEEHLAAACPMAHVDRDGFLQLLRH
ncbi:hypothetical protein QJQ45_015444 [Haematococcus lacustris]|nr:hypothetical protein QJQ45_015444 [Haematococcus lacustris]